MKVYSVDNLLKVFVPMMKASGATTQQLTVLADAVRRVTPEFVKVAISDFRAGLLDSEIRELYRFHKGPISEVNVQVEAISNGLQPKMSEIFGPALEAALRA